MDGLKTRGIHHVALVTADAERSEGFYGGLLGLRAVERPETGPEAEPASHGRVFSAAGGGPGTLLTVAERPGWRKGRWGVGGVHHVALGVGTEDALLKWKRRLTDAGVAVTGPYDRGYFTSLYFADPDGQVLEIATAGPGYLVDESFEELGRELRIPPERLLRGHRDEAAIAALTWPEPVPSITSDMELDGIHHVSGITDDLELARDWYPAVLGLELVKRTLNRDDGRTRHYFWGVREGDGVAAHSSWTLFGWPGSSYRSREGVGQTRRVAFRAEGDEPLEAWRDHLLRLGTEVTGPLPGRRFRSLRFRAPDGTHLELATDGPGYPVE